jgi:hypothetical protein
MTVKRQLRELYIYAGREQHEIETSFRSTIHQLSTRAY